MHFGELGEVMLYLFGLVIVICVILLILCIVVKSRAIKIVCISLFICIIVISSAGITSERSRWMFISPTNQKIIGKVQDNRQLLSYSITSTAQIPDGNGVLVNFQEHPAGRVPGVSICTITVRHDHERFEVEKYQYAQEFNDRGYAGTTELSDYSVKDGFWKSVDDSHKPDSKWVEQQYARFEKKMNMKIPRNCDVVMNQGK